MKYIHCELSNLIGRFEHTMLCTNISNPLPPPFTVMILSHSSYIISFANLRELVVIVEVRNCQAKVCYLTCHVLRHQHVAGLYVPVHYLVAMEICQT